MTGQGQQIFVDELTRFAQQTADQRIEALAEQTAAPLRVAVHGRPGVGRGMVARSLARAGVYVTDDTPDLRIQVVAEVVKPEDIQGLRPALAVLTKADLTLLRRDGSLQERLSAMIGAPVLPMSGLLAVAALDGLDAQCWAGLRALAAHPNGLNSLDGSYDGFLTAPLPVPVATRTRLLRALDLFGVAVCVTALRRGAGPGQVRALLRRVSGVDAVLQWLVPAGAQVRYRRVRDAVAELEVLAVGDPGIDAFLTRDDTVIARMAAALDAVAAEGGDPGPEAPLPRALHWQRYRRPPAGEVQRACAADIARGALRLWSRAGGAALREVR